MPKDGDNYLRVGDEKLRWEEGKMIMFDDTYEHEAYNNSEKESRVVLLIDLWHPDLVPEEKQAIKNMFQVVKDMVQQR